MHIQPFSTLHAVQTALKWACLALVVATTVQANIFFNHKPEDLPESAMFCHNTSYACVTATYNVNVNPLRSVLPAVKQWRKDGVQGWVFKSNPAVRLEGTCPQNQPFIVNVNFGKRHADVLVGKVTCELHSTNNGDGMEAIIDCP
ncbi:unnamed protein product [Parajaminaea phylloscopi]